MTVFCSELRCCARTGPIGQLTNEDLTDIDMRVDRLVNGDILGHSESVANVVRFAVDLAAKRLFELYEEVILRLQETIEFGYKDDLLPDYYVSTSQFRCWGEDGQEIECYGIDLDILFQQNEKVPSLLPLLLHAYNHDGLAIQDRLYTDACNMSYNDWIQMNRPKPSIIARHTCSSTDFSSQAGNWAWQMCVEVVGNQFPVDYIQDIGNGESNMPDMDAHYKHLAHYSDVEIVRSERNESEMVDIAASNHPSAHVVARNGTFVDLNSSFFAQQRVRSRRRALPLVTQARFEFSRELTERALREYIGPYGPVSEFFDSVLFEYELEDGSSESGVVVHTTPQGSKYIKQEARPAWIIAKWIVTRKEAERKAREDEQIYLLAVRLRELLLEHVASAEGVEQLSFEARRRKQRAERKLRAQRKKVWRSSILCRN